MSKKYDVIVYIGRFQPFHNAHLEILNRAISLSEKVVVILGSSFQPRTYKNPFTITQRELMIYGEIGIDTLGKVKIFPARDSMYNDQAWAIRIQQIVAENSPIKAKIGIIGHEKDESSFYLKMFPQWDHIDVECIEPLHSTDIRDLYFREEVNMNYIKGVVPETTFALLNSYKETEHYDQILKERFFIEDYKRQYAGFPYPPTFVTTDAVVVQSGHVLMVKRRSEPGKGLLALPGGFLNADTDKSMVDCCIRELKEETRIKVPTPVLIGSIKDTKVFDAINRSARGRTITHAFHIELPDGELSKVKGSDDAEKAMWVPIGKLDSVDCFEDHFDIINYFVGA